MIMGQKGMCAYAESSTRQERPFQLAHGYQARLGEEVDRDAHSC